MSFLRAPSLPVFGPFSPVSRSIFLLTILVCLGGCFAEDAAQSGLDPESRANDKALPLSEEQALRFLVQASFGPRPGDIQELQQIGVQAWLAQQIFAPSAYDSDTDPHLSHLQRTVEIAMMAEPSKGWFGGGFFNANVVSERIGDYQLAAYLDNILGSDAPNRRKIGSDPLRQRVAYALNELIVLPAVDGYQGKGEVIAQFADVLARHALGNFRELLREVTISPGMGIGLSSYGNRKYDPVTGQRPDENYAREIMQLFSIGLYELNRDGTPNRDGNPNTSPDPGEGRVPSYTQKDVVEFAKIMTGWDLAGVNPYGSDLRHGLDLTRSMEFHSDYHEDEIAEGGDGRAEILGVSVPLNAGADGSGLDAAIEVLVQHPNTGPFLAKHLITNMVTANPDPAYVEVVASAFEDDGTGVRGNLAAMVYTMLMHPAARNDAYVEQESFGMVKEPFLALVQALLAQDVRPLPNWRSIEGAVMNDVYWFPKPVGMLGQGPLRSSSPFNFFSPEFVPPDPQFSDNGWVAPSLQIQSGTSLIGFDAMITSSTDVLEKTSIEYGQGKTLEQFGSQRSQALRWNWYTNATTELAVFEFALDGNVNGSFTNIQQFAAKQTACAALVEHLNRKLCGGRLSIESRRGLVHYLVRGEGANAPNGQNFEEARRVVREALRMITNSPAYRIQK